MNGPQPHERSGANAAGALREAVGRARQRHRSKQATTRSRRRTRKRDRGRSRGYAARGSWKHPMGGQNTPWGQRLFWRARYPMGGRRLFGGTIPSARSKALREGASGPEGDTRRGPSSPVPRTTTHGARGHPPLPHRIPTGCHYVRHAYYPCHAPAHGFLQILQKMSTWPIRDWPPGRRRGPPHGLTYSLDKATKPRKTWKS